MGVKKIILVKFQICNSQDRENVYNLISERQINWIIVTLQVDKNNKLL